MSEILWQHDLTKPMGILMKSSDIGEEYTERTFKLEYCFCTECGGFLKTDESVVLATNLPKHRQECTECKNVTYRNLDKAP